MPTTIKDHVTYTQNELRDLPYYKEMLSILKEEMIESYIDIGANTGEYAKILFDKISTLKKCYLIEPDVDNFKFMTNHVSDLNECVLYNIAIGYGATRGRVMKSFNTGGHQIEKMDNGGDVEIKTLESLELPIVDFIKMDVEGMEFEIIEKSEYLKKVKWLDIEFHQNLEQVQNEFVKNFILDKLPNFDIILYQKDGVNDYGRCLLKNKDI